MSKQLPRRRTDMWCALRACLHAWIHGPCSPQSHMPQWKPAQTPNTLCGAAAGVNAGVTRHVSHSIPSARTGDSPRGQKWAKDGNLIPTQKSGSPTSAASVIRSSCDTAAMCWGLFLRNGRVELESNRILLASVWTMKWRGWKTCWGTGRRIKILVNYKTVGPGTSLLRNKRFAHLATSMPIKRDLVKL